MIIAPVRSQVAFSEGRLDAKYYCSPGVLANERVQMLGASGVVLRTVGGDGGLGQVGATSRTRRVYAAQGEESLPYLRPYDVFDYLPQPAGQLSKSGSAGLESLMPEVGTILQTCSGRNLGPLAYADEYISQFVVSDDMLRLHIADETDRLYVLAFLSTPTGQALLTRSKTGNVIDLNIVKSAHQHHRSLRVVLRLEKIALHVNDSKDLSALQNPASDVGVAGIVEYSVRDDHGHPTCPGLKQM